VGPTAGCGGSVYLLPFSSDLHVLLVPIREQITKFYLLLSVMVSGKRVGRATQRGCAVLRRCHLLLVFPCSACSSLGGWHISV
jgi:hypothetical protein